jgi:hypothetical protein
VTKEGEGAAIVGWQPGLEGRGNELGGRLRVAQVKLSPPLLKSQIALRLLSALKIINEMCITLTSSCLSNNATLNVYYFFTWYSFVHVHNKFSSHSTTSSSAVFSLYITHIIIVPVLHLWF